MHYIGVDLGGTNIAVGLVDENRENTSQRQRTYRKRKAIWRNHQRYGNACSKGYR